jgi:hypothetical protein
MGYISRRWLSLSKKRKSTAGQKIYPDKLSRGQIIFLMVMTVSLITYIVIRMVDVYGI